MENVLHFLWNSHKLVLCAEREVAKDLVEKGYFKTTDDVPPGLCEFILNNIRRGQDIAYEAGLNDGEGK